MKRLLPILLLVFSVGVGDVYGGNRELSPEMERLGEELMEKQAACRIIQFEMGEHGIKVFGVGKMDGGSG